jgi:hypothetical protein
VAGTAQGRWLVARADPREKAQRGRVRVRHRFAYNSQAARQRHNLWHSVFLLFGFKSLL